MKHWNRITAVAAASALAGLLLGVSAPASATAATAYRIGSCTAQGDYAVCVASGSATRPVDIYVHVTSDPGQQVQVYWDMVCSKGDGAGSKSGSFTAGTPVRRLIRHPYGYPDSCDVSADAQLATGGYLHVWLSYRR